MSTSIHTAVHEPCAAWLDGRARNDTSQYGEDGLIEACLDRTGVTNRWCFEVGAADGLYFSNTKRLRDAGWDAMLIEANDDHYAKLEGFRSDRVRTIRRRIGPDSLDSILATCGAPVDPDLGVIDIDGQDWWAWNGLVDHRPRIMLVEVGVVSDDAPVPELGAEGQAGLNAIVELGESKGYVFVARTRCNALFVDGGAL